jgi:hypothetical protein
MWVQRFDQDGIIIGQAIRPNCRGGSSGRMGGWFESIDFPLQYNYIVVMVDLNFEWDHNKNLSNQKKHGVSLLSR